MTDTCLPREGIEGFARLLRAGLLGRYECAESTSCNLWDLVSLVLAPASFIGYAFAGFLALSVATLLHTYVIYACFRVLPSFVRTRNPEDGLQLFVALCLAFILGAAWSGM